MERRSFLSALGLVFFPLKGLTAPKWTPQFESSLPDLITIKEGQTFSLPRKPQVGELIHFQAQGDWQLNPPVIARNGHKIMGESSDLTLDINQSFALEYHNADMGWVFTSPRS